MRVYISLVRLALAAALAVAFMAGASSAVAQAAAGPVIEWQTGPTVAQLAGVAQLSVPAGYRFTGPEGAKRVMELTENPTSGKEVGILAPSGHDTRPRFRRLIVDGVSCDVS